MAWMKKSDGTQPGDPKKAAEAIVGVVSDDFSRPSHANGSSFGQANTSSSRRWPGMLILGGDAERDVRSKCERVLEHLDEWKDVTRSIDINGETEQ